MDPTDPAPIGPSELARLSDELAEARAETERVIAFHRGLLESLSREVRAPIHMIVGAAGTLESRALAADERELAELIQRGCDALFSVVTDVIDLSALEARGLIPRPEQFVLAKVIDDVLAGAAKRAFAKNLELSSFLPSHLTTALHGDRARLERLLATLLGVAIHAADRGEVTIEAKKLEETTKLLALSIEILISPLSRETTSEIAEIFRPECQRLDPLGVAAAVCRRICATLGAELTIECPPGRSARFAIAARFEKSEPIVTTIPDLSGARILVVEAQPQLRRSIVHQLAIAGAKAESAASGSEALERIGKAIAQGEGHALIITGGRLPDMEAGHLVRKVRGIGVANLPFIRLRETKARLEASEGLFFVELARPVRSEELWTFCQVALGRARPAPKKLEVPSVVQRILIAEDHPISQKVAARMLEGLGYRADIVADGTEVLQALEKQHYDLVLMDWMMPEMDGLTATTEIRKREAQGASSPVRIVAMTANAMTGDRERCLAAGMDDYLSKPVKASQLLTMLRRWL
jgi:CheY-like chemotaxis protein